MQTTVQTTGGKLFPFVKPILFVLEVNNIKLTAQLQSAQLQKEIGYIYKIKFSDGHEDEYAIQSWKIYNSTDRTDPYCKALENEIHAVLFSWNESKPLICFQTEIKGDAVNIWITGIKKEEFYSVYVFNSKLFDIVKINGEWSFKKTAGSVAVSKEVTEKIKLAIGPGIIGFSI